MSNRIRNCRFFVGSFATKAKKNVKKIKIKGTHLKKKKKKSGKVA